MLNTITIPHESGWTTSVRTKQATTRWFHPTVTVDIDELVHELAGNTVFANYVELSNKEILKNPDKFEDMAEKYK